MAEAQTDIPKSLLEQYKLSVENLQTKLDVPHPDESQIETLFLRIITLRETINIQLHSEQPLLDLNTETLAMVASTDDKLYYAVRLLRQKTRINPSQWQYILPEPEKAGWWWRLHQIPVWMDDKIEYENRFSVALIPAILLILISLAIAAFSTQQMWASGEQWIGNVSLIGQILVGLGLVSSSGREIGTRLLNQFTNLFNDLFRNSATGNLERFPLARHRSNISLGILGAAILFFSFVFLFTTLAIPASARWFHNMGVRAVEERNVSLAEFYLELAVAVQPDFAPVSMDFSGAPSFNQLGNLYREIGDLEAAQEAYENALSENALDVHVHYRLAEIYLLEEDIPAAFAVLDRALFLIDEHLAGRQQLPLGTDVIDSDNEARQLKYLTLITRAKAFLAVDGGYRTAIRDLDNARSIVASHSDLFVTRDNMQQRQVERILTTEMHVLFARSLRSLFDDNCATQVQDEWRVVRLLSRFARTSNEQLWQDEANVALDACP